MVSGNGGFERKRAAAGHAAHVQREVLQPASGSDKPESVRAGCTVPGAGHPAHVQRQILQPEQA